MRGPGSRVGSWVLDRLLGQGGNGRVWLAHHGTFDTRAAVKITRQAEPHRVAAFQAEVRRVARLDHPCIVQLFDAGVEQGVPWYAMEPMGGSLRDVCGTLSWATGQRVLLALLDALAHAHAHGLIHRDVKPENVLIVARECPTDLRLSDFGLAVDSDRVGRAGEFAGSPLYMAPEQRDGDWRRYGPWTDLYAVGRVALELFALDTTLPPGLQRWVARACAADPADRFPRAADARAALLAIDPIDEVRRAARSTLPRATGAALVRHRLPPLFGRGKELAAITAALDEAIDHGEARLRLLSGPPGVGKSHLAQASCVDAHREGRADWIRIAPGDRAAVDPGLGVALASFLRVAELAQPELDSHLELLLPDLDRTARELISARWAVGQLELPTSLLAALVRAMAAQRPLVLWIDDAPRSTGALGLAQSLLSLDAPLLLLLTADDDEPPAADLDPLLNHRRAGRLTCTRLEDQAVGELLNTLVPIDTSLRVRLTQRVAGNPLLAVTLLDDWQERGLLVEGFEGWNVAPGAVLPLPTDLADAALGRIQRALGDVDGFAIELAAVSGDPVDPALWRRACQHARLEPDHAAVGRLVQARLAVLEGGGSWRWSHPMVREALVHRAENGGREGRWHRACAAALAGATAFWLRERRVRHLLAAGAPLEADRDALDLADQLIHVGAIASSEVLLSAREEALTLAGIRDDHPAWGAGWCRWATLSQRRGSFRAAEAWLERALDHAEEPRVAARIALARGILATVQGQVHDAAEAFAEATRRAREMGDEVLVGIALTHAARVGTKAADPESSIQLATEAVAQLRPLDQPTHLADALQALAAARNIAGDPVGARAALDEAIALARRVGAPGTLFHALNVRGVLAHLSGDLEAAERDYAEALAMRDGIELGFTSVTAVEVNQAVLKQDRGDFEGARTLLEPLRRASADRGRPVQELLLLSFFLPCLAHDGDWADLSAELAVAARLWAEVRYTEPGVIRALRRTAELAESASQAELSLEAMALATRMQAALPG